MVKYYSILRPVGPGTAPKGFVEFKNYKQRRYIEAIGRAAWGYLIYENEIDNPEDWDLVKAEEKKEKTKKMAERRLYLAYGSNLSVEQMADRCPDAKIVGVSIIRDYRLMYKGSMTGAYATIEPEKGSIVPVLVWDISREDERRLDIYEGYPRFYRKKELTVDIKLISDKKPAPSYGTYKAMAYVMDKTRKHGHPSPHYEQILRDGYKEFGFDIEILDEAFSYTIQKIYGNAMVE